MKIKSKNKVGLQCIVEILFPMSSFGNRSPHDDVESSCRDNKYVQFLSDDYTNNA